MKKTEKCAVSPKKKIFLSWSGENEKKIALQIKDSLESLYPVSVFVSDEDIGGQERGWRDSIIKNISASSYGVVCISPLNKNRPWLLYEAGALEGHLKFKNVSILALSLAPDEIPSPLKGKQVRVLNKSGYSAFLNDFEKGMKGLEKKKKFTDSSWRSFAKKISPYLDDIKNKSEANGREENIAVRGDNSLNGGLRVESGCVIKTYEPHTPRIARLQKWHVEFEVPFIEPPKILCSLNLADCTSIDFPLRSSTTAKPILATTSRIKVETSNVTEKGFDIIAGTWSNNILHGVGVNWIAIGQGKK